MALLLNFIVNPPEADKSVGLVVRPMYKRRKAQGERPTERIIDDITLGPVP
jgi:hypothetical protein